MTDSTLVIDASHDAQPPPQASVHVGSTMGRMQGDEQQQDAVHAPAEMVGAVSAQTASETRLDVGPRVLDFPHAVTACVLKGYGACLIVTDTDSKRLAVLASDDGRLLTWIGSGVRDPARRRTLKSTVAAVLKPGGVQEEGHSDDRISEAEFNGPHGVCVGPTGAIFVADAYNQVIRRVSELRVEVCKIQPPPAPASVNAHAHKTCSPPPPRARTNTHTMHTLRVAVSPST